MKSVELILNQRKSSALERMGNGVGEIESSHNRVGNGMGNRVGNIIYT